MHTIENLKKKQASLGDSHARPLLIDSLVDFRGPLLAAFHCIMKTIKRTARILCTLLEMLDCEIDFFPPILIFVTGTTHM